VRLTGLSTVAFGRAAAASDETFRKMGAQFEENKINKWENTLYEGHVATDYNARYFTNRSEAKNEVNLPFVKGVDPNGILADLRGQDLIHGPDNQVMYYRHHENGRCAHKKTWTWGYY
jgi:hypothetical protein